MKSNRKVTHNIVLISMSVEDKTVALNLGGRVQFTSLSRRLTRLFYRQTPSSNANAETSSFQVLSNSMYTVSINITEQ
jgi:hypothetical protein